MIRARNAEAAEAKRAESEYRAKQAALTAANAERIAKSKSDKLLTDLLAELTEFTKLAERLTDKGIHVESLKILERALVRRKELLGTEHPSTIQTLQKLADVYFALGRHADALKLRQETLVL